MDDNILRIVVFGIVTFLVAMIITPSYIRLLRRLKLAKKIRTEASLGGGKATKYHALHAHKQWTPNMGGGMILIVVAIMVAATVFLKFIQWPLGFDLNYTLWNRNETYLPLFALFSMGILGAIDDYLNVRDVGGKKWMSARVKMFGLTLFSFAGAWWFFTKLGNDSITIPGYGLVDIGWWYVGLSILIITAMANSVNITDGLDGLAGGLLAQNYFLYAFITYNENLFLLSTICVVIAAALAAFLWFNIKPAQFYLGDAGALGLWGGLAVMALMTDTLVVLVIVSLIYIWEILSVIIQVTSKKLRRKKVFLIAPYHHHLEAKGMMEETIVMRFWLLGALLSASGLIFYLLPPLW
jgi:phospho-N-acetylmuramoyl-pentapeptide-transferase